MGGVYYSTIKKEEGNPAICDNIDGLFESIMLSGISQTKKDKYCTTSLTCGISKKTKLIGTEIVICPVPKIVHST